MRMVTLLGNCRMLCGNGKATHVAQQGNGTRPPMTCAEVDVHVGVQRSEFRVGEPIQTLMLISSLLLQT